MRRLLTVTLALFFIFVTLESVTESARVKKIPGFKGTFPSKHFSGYVTIDKDHGKKLFYYFVESERSPSKDPVVLWLNGGPGCSSFFGFIYEHGPFNFEAGKKKTDLPRLHLNPYSWSKVSNIIYVDSPAGTGFSYSNNKTDYRTSELKTASDLHKFLLKWFKLFSKFKSNPFFLSGESYAGVYVPTLASEIVRGNDADKKKAINLKGYLIGNGLTKDAKFDDESITSFVRGMGLISSQLFEEFDAACVTHSGPEFCQTKIMQVVQLTDKLNHYNILEPCYHKNDSVAAGQTEKPPLQAPVPGSPKLKKRPGGSCFDDSIATVWLNDVSVRKAIHAKKENVIRRRKLCTHEVSVQHDSGSMIGYHRNLTMRGIRALIYSGDHDMVVPYTGTEAWTRSMGYEIVDLWRPWFSNEQVAGYIQGYANNLTFLTIKGSGHEVPKYKPREALHFYSQFLSGRKI